MYIFRLLLLDGQSWRHPVRQIPRVDFQIDHEFRWYELLLSENSDVVDTHKTPFVRLKHEAYNGFQNRSNHAS